MREPNNRSRPADPRQAALGNWLVLVGFSVAAVGMLGSGITYAVQGRWGWAGFNSVIFLALLAGIAISWRERRKLRTGGARSRPDRR